MNYRLSLVEILLGVSLLLIFAKYPIFPETLSGDYSQHLTAATNIAHGLFPSLSSSILYVGIQLYLGLAVKLFPAVPLATIRYAMGLLVFISPLIVYLSSKEIFSDSRIGFWIAAFYALSGFVWFGSVFNAGLYANFWGLLSSLMLIASVIRFAEKGVGVSSLSLLIASLTNALFSHYSTLFVFPPLMLYLAFKRNWLGLGTLTIPLLAGFALFPNILVSLIPFINGSSTTIIQPTFLASLIPIPTLSYMIDEISANLIGDLAAVVALSLGGFFVYRSFKIRNGKMLIFSIWFLICLLIPVYTSNAWRFAFVGLMPLTVMAGWSLSNLRPIPFLPSPKVFLFIFLLLTPAFGSWSNLSFWDAATSTTQTNGQQNSDLQAIRWMLANLPSNCGSKNATKCGLVVVNDLNFLYLPYMDTRQYVPSLGGLSVFYAPFSNVIFTNPLQVQLFAGGFGPYILVSKDGTASNAPCDIGGTFGLAMTANTTITSVNHAIDLKLDGVKGLNATVAIWDGEKRVIEVGMIGGHAEITASFGKGGNHTLYLGLGNLLTSPMKIHVVGSNPTLTGSKTVIVPRDYCQPWSSFNVASMRGWSVIYHTENVRLYKTNL